MRDIGLMFHYFGLAMTLGSAFTVFFVSRAAKKMDNDEAAKFRVQSFALNSMEHIGFSFLLIAGLYLMTPYWAILASKPLLITKLSLVFVFGWLSGTKSRKMRKARKGDTSLFRTIDILNNLTLLLLLTIVVLAVLTFH